jgi:hypothetical protein
VGGAAGEAGLSAADLIELIAPQLTAASKKTCAEGGSAGTPGNQGLDGKMELEN